VASPEAEQALGRRSKCPATPKETAPWLADRGDAAAVKAQALLQPDEAEAEHSDAQQQGAAVEAEQASEAQALTQRISRRWFEESHYRRDQNAIEIRCV